jgi:hypothetical protein
MKLRKIYDRVSAPLDAGAFVGRLVAEEAFSRHGHVETLEAKVEVLGRFCQAMFNILPEKTRAKIATEFGWEPVDAP